MFDILHDLRFALRTFRRSPGFALAAILTLALGIGANVTVFGIADAVLLKMLPVREPQRLIQILQPVRPPARSTGNIVPGGYSERFTFADYRDMQQAAHGLVDLLAESPPYSAEMVIQDSQETVRYAAVSGNYFGALGVKPAMGRAMEPSIDNEPGRHPDVVISYSFWERRFHRDPGVIGRTIQYSGTHFQIIGVAERGFFGLQVGSVIDVWMPAIMEKRDLRTSGFLRLIARLRPGVSATQALAPLQVWRRQTLIERWGPDQSRTAQLKAVPAAKGMSPLREQYGEPIQIVFGVVAVILLLACANVANLLLARASVRQREMAVRKSVGASRMRLVRQLLTESLALTAIAAVAGLLAARWTGPLLIAMLAPSDTPVQLAVELDARVLAFVAAVSLFAVIGCGILPALRASQVDIHSSLKSGGAASRGLVWQSSFMVALQMALSLVLLVASALFVRTLVNLKTFDPGFDRHNLVLADVQFRGAATDDRLSLEWQELLRRVNAMPGVESASASIGSPLRSSRRAGEPRIANGPWDDTLPMSWFMPVSTGYFRTFGGSLVKGRDFEPRDFEPPAPGVAILNETMARLFFGTGNPLGQKLNDYGPKPPEWAETIEVIGVATDMKFDSLRTPPPSIVYLPFTQRGAAIKLPLGIMTLDVRTRQDSGSLARALQRELAAANPAFAIRNMTTQSKLVDDALIRERLLATVGGFFGILALLLAGIGLYGTMSYSVSRRTQEIGIRMALGAGQPQVLRMVLREALATVAIGGLAGIAAAILVARIVASLLFGLKPQDPSTIVLAAAMLTATSLAAAFAPALRASRTSPMDALRNE